MTVTEMHIAVNQGVQKIASFQVDNLLPQEIDHELNLAMMRFIKQRFSMTSNRVGKGFEQSQKRIDDLRTLVVDHKDSTNTQGAVYTSNYSDIYVDRYTLPLDYLFLISVRATVEYGCGGPVAVIDTPPIIRKAVKINLTPPQPGYVLTAIYRQTSSGSYESIINLPVGQEITTDLLLDNTNYNFGVIPATSAQIPNYGITVQSPSQVDSNHIYMVNSATYNGDPIWNGPGYIKTAWIPQGGNMSGAQYRPESEIETALKDTRRSDGGSTRISLASFAQHDDILYMMDDPFNKAWYKEPTYTIEGNYIDVYTDNEFVVPYVTTKYIRKPLEISITTGVGCELAVHTHHEIVEMTIKSILEGIQDPRYQTQSMETLESE